jgi:hypothetical protein
VAKLARVAYKPDIMFFAAENYARLGEVHCQGADLVMEVVGLDAESHDRDYVKKRRDYAEAGIASFGSSILKSSESPCWCWMAISTVFTANSRRESRHHPFC